MAQSSAPSKGAKDVGTAPRRKLKGGVTWVTETADKDAMAKERATKENALAESFGFARLNDVLGGGSARRLGYLFNMKPSLLLDKESARMKACVDFYFIGPAGDTFRAALVHQPYFFVGASSEGDDEDAGAREAEAFLRRKFGAVLSDVERVPKIDLAQPNHLAGLRRTYLRLKFHTVQELLQVRSELRPLVERNARTRSAAALSGDLHDHVALGQARSSASSSSASSGGEAALVELRESDVTYYERVNIDVGVRAGRWYDVSVLDAGTVDMKERTDMAGIKAPLRVLAFDIECTKKPLKFPDAATDEVMMISYMLDAAGYLIVNREHVGADIADFEYTPKPEFPGTFHVFNESNEAALLARFVSEIKRTRPTLFVTFNGDGFDWPFVEARARVHGVSLSDAIGLSTTTSGAAGGEAYALHCAPHLDCFKWVKRDSYLPQGSQGLKSVTKIKLGYTPLEVDPEEMVAKARNEPQAMASYSVSDAVATFYLYNKYVQPFIFSLCTIIPLHPDDVLRKGSGTLCESLLMVEATRGNIIFPNKQGNGEDSFHRGGLIESETYVGGHVEQCASGVFRADVPMKFALDVSKVREVLGVVDDIMRFAIEEEAKAKLSDIGNYAAVRAKICAQLEALMEQPKRSERPLIYHVDVAAMYPNIILTNRLQPTAIVTESTCAACLYNHADNDCKRKMEWQWRVDYVPTNRAEYLHIKHQLERERFPAPASNFAPKRFGEKDKGKDKGKDKDREHEGEAGEEEAGSKDPKSGAKSSSSATLTTAALVPFYKLPAQNQQSVLKARLRDYAKKVYKKGHVVETVLREDTVCQRENSFYVDTVRMFRDRRYEYKELLKHAQRKAGDAVKTPGTSPAELDKAANLVVYYDSLQLAHKCILNSFYGYVMRKGARWYSMEMAAIVTHTGAQIIRQARETIERLGQPLELDTDGIWCALPATWPENFDLLDHSGKKRLTMSFICTLLNRQTHVSFTNAQYQEWDSAAQRYGQRSECTVFFEVDGPYRAMVIPTALEEDAQLKKRYVVYLESGKVAELKGFEMKRRGELRLIKDFQAQAFPQYLAGSQLSDAYRAVGDVAEHFLSVLDSKGSALEDEELLALLSESKHMSRTLADYGAAKSMQITTARRLGEVLGLDFVRDAGVTCQWIVAREPLDAPVTERAVPTVIFSADPATRRTLLRKWTRAQGSSAAGDLALELRAVIDWDYYRQRLSATLQKMVTLPAFVQGLPNPVPRVAHPQWALRRLREQSDPHRQTSLLDTFAKKDPKELKDEEPIPMQVADMEDAFTPNATTTSSSRKRKAESAASVPVESTPSEQLKAYDLTQAMACPSEGDDYEGWLKWHQQRWRLQRRARKHRRDLSALSAATPPNKRSGVQGFFGTRETALVTGDWQLLQLRATARPGELEAWLVLKDGQMQRVTLSVPKKLYVNAYKAREVSKGTGVTARKVTHTLPRTRVRHELYELELDEAHYAELSALAQGDAEAVEGVYERHVPPTFRAVLELGCVAKVKSEHRGHKHSTWQLGQLQRVDEGAKHYMTSAQQRPRLLYLYESHSSDDNGRALYALYVPQEERAHLVFVAPFVQEPMTGVQAALRKALGDAVAQKLACDVQRHVDAPSALRAVGALLAADQRSHGSAAALVILQSSLSESELRSRIAALNAYPTLALAHHDKDNAYPPFAWFTHPAALFAQYLVHVPAQFDTLLSLARFTQVPIGNFALDYPLHLLDVLYARELKASNHVLWYSDATRPDLGGHELDDHSSSSSSNTSSSSSTPSSSASVSEVCSPGAWQTSCAEFELSGLAVNTLLCAPHLSTLDSDAALFDQASENDNNNNNNQQTQVNPLDEASTCAKAFRVLRSLVNSWANAARDTPVAKSLANSLYRWLASAQAKLHDPALLRLVQRLESKVLAAFLSETRKLGCEIVYATPQRLVIATRQCTLKDADEHVRFVRKTLRARPLFKYLGLDVKEMWDALLFRDAYNWCAVPATHLRPSERAQQDVAVRARWHLGSLLPPQAQKRFLFVVTDFVRRLYLSKPDSAEALAQQQLAQQSRAQRAAKDEASDTRGTSQHSALAEWSAARDEQLTLEMRTLWQGLVPRLFAVTTEVRSAIGDASEGQGLSAVTSVPVPVQFVTLVCHVLALHSALESEVTILKRSLLKIVDVAEFAPEAEFRDTSACFVLRDVTCAFCNLSRDVDLLRDTDFTSSQDWRCVACTHALSRAHLEQRLLAQLRESVAAYQLQDLRCRKCGALKATSTRLICARCSGPFETVASASNELAWLHALQLVARTHALPWLAEELQWTLQHAHA